MITRIVTTNPAGHTVSMFKGFKSICDLKLEYEQFYENVAIHYDHDSIPEGIYLICFDGVKSIWYQVKYHKKGL